MSFIVIDDITKAFGDKIVFSHFSCSFPKGTISCIMGKSGIGKTTLLNLVLGVETPDSGSIKGVPNHLSSVFQEDRLCETFTSVGNVKAVTGKNVPESEIIECLSKLGLSDSIHLPVASLSGGMKRRVAIARALLAESELLVMDEPFKGLDEATRAKVADTIVSYSSGKTLLISTHDATDADLLGGTVINIDI